MLPSSSSQAPARKAASARPEKRIERRHTRDSRRIANAVTFQHDQKSCSQLLFDLLQAAPREGMSVRTLIHSLGERGLLMACMIFCLPSMVPIPLPGISIPQGFIIGLIGLGLLLNRAPMLPDRVLEFRLAHSTLALLLGKGTQLFSRIEKLTHPRMDFLSEGIIIRAVNGTLLVVGAALLMAPFPIPFSNILPAYAILFLAFGMIERDGWLIIGSYLMLILSIAYIGVVLTVGTAWIYSFFR